MSTESLHMLDVDFHVVFALRHLFQTSHTNIQCRLFQAFDTLSTNYLPLGQKRKKFLPCPKSRLVFLQNECINVWWSAFRFFGKTCKVLFFCTLKFGFLDHYLGPFIHMFMLLMMESHEDRPKDRLVYAT